MDKENELPLPPPPPFKTQRIGEPNYYINKIMFENIMNIFGDTINQWEHRDNMRFCCKTSEIDKLMEIADEIKLNPKYAGLSISDIYYILIFTFYSLVAHEQLDNCLNFGDISMNIQNKPLSKKLYLDITSYNSDIKPEDTFCEDPFGTLYEFDQTQSVSEPDPFFNDLNRRILGLSGGKRMNSSKRKNSSKLYKITNYTKKKAKKLGLLVRPSTNNTKKIDVFKKGKKIASVGANGMNDFPTYISNRGLKYAKTRRRLYKQRHEKDRHKKWTNGWLADHLLW